MGLVQVEIKSHDLVVEDFSGFNPLLQVRAGFYAAAVGLGGGYQLKKPLRTIDLLGATQTDDPQGASARRCIWPRRTNLLGSPRYFMTERMFWQMQVEPMRVSPPYPLLKLVGLRRAGLSPCTKG
jgi:hypothetical protein